MGPVNLRWLCEAQDNDWSVSEGGAHLTGECLALLEGVFVGRIERVCTVRQQLGYARSIHLTLVRVQEPQDRVVQACPNQKFRTAHLENVDDITVAS